MSQTPEERAKSVLHFLDEYLRAREAVHMPPETGRAYKLQRAEVARSFLGAALVALVTDAKENVDD